MRQVCDGVRQVLVALESLAVVLNRLQILTNVFVARCQVGVGFGMDRLDFQCG